MASDPWQMVGQQFRRHFRDFEPRDWRGLRDDQGPTGTPFIGRMPNGETLSGHGPTRTRAMAVLTGALPSRPWIWHRDGGDSSSLNSDKRLSP